MKKNLMYVLIVFIAILLALFLPFPDSMFRNLPEVLFMLIFFFIFLSIISAINGVKQRKREVILMQSGIYEIDHMEGLQFEEYLAVLFKRLGYNVRTTKATGDYGADLVLEKDNVRTVVQAKRYSSKVSIDAVQQIVASKSYYNAEKALVVTNNYFTKPAIILAESNNISLIDRESLVEMIMSLKNNENSIPNREGLK